jgi:hypothetical protein
LAFFALEPVGHQPFPHKLFAQLALFFAASLAFGIAVGIEITRAVGRMNFIHEQNLTVFFAEFVLGIYQDKSLPGGHFGTPAKQGAGVGFHLFVIGPANEPACQDFLPGNIFVVAFVGLGGWGNDGFRERVVLAQTFRQGHAAQNTATGGISAGSVTGQVAADHHFHPHGFAAMADGHVGIGCGEEPVGADVAGSVEKIGGYLVQHGAFVRDSPGQDVIEGRNAVAGYHHQPVADGVHITDFAAVKSRLAGQLEIRFADCWHGKFEVQSLKFEV